MAQPYPDQDPKQAGNTVTDVYTPKPPLENDFITHQVELSGLNVLAAENAVSGLQIQRNIIDMTDSSGNVSEIQSEFTYTTGLVSFTNPITPFIVNDTKIDVAQLPEQKGPELSERIATLMEDLLVNSTHAERFSQAMTNAGQGGAGAPRRVKVECNYDYPIVAADGKVPNNPIRVTIPVVLARSFDIEPAETPITDFATQYAESISSWANERNIVFGADSKPPGTCLVFDITLYAVLSGSNTPVLELTNLQLKLTDIAQTTTP